MPRLTWLTRDDDLKATAAVPYRLLEPVPELGHGDQALPLNDDDLATQIDRLLRQRRAK